MRYEVSAVVGAVVAHVKGGDFKVAYIEGKFFVDWVVIVLQPARHTVATHDAVESLWGTVYGYAGFLTRYGVDESHVVAVVVGQAYTLYLIEAQAVGFKSLCYVSAPPGEAELSKKDLSGAT